MNFNWSSCPNSSSNNNCSRTPQSDQRPQQPKWPKRNWQMTLRRDQKESLGLCQKFKLKTVWVRFVLFFWVLLAFCYCLLIKNCKHVLYWQHKSHLFNLQTSFTLRNLIKKVVESDSETTPPDTAQVKGSWDNALTNMKASCCSPSTCCSCFQKYSLAACQN